MGEKNSLAWWIKKAFMKDLEAQKYLNDLQSGKKIKDI